MGRSKVVSIKKECPATWGEALQQFLWWKQAQGVSKMVGVGLNSPPSTF
jgi:hypothetical protein